MKIKHIGIIIAIAFVAAGGWFARLAWRAHLHLVTLHVRNTPLADVIRSIERQTWEKIRVDNRLKARITLNVDNAPLSHALDLVSAKAGARWAKTYAVYNSAGALRDLETVLKGDAKLEAAGWTNLAPQFESPELPDMPARPDGKGQRPRGPFVFKDNGITRMITFSPDGSTNIWCSERLVLESTLAAKLIGPPPSEATPETAAQVASSIHGQTSLYYTLDPGGLAAGGFGGSKMVRRTIGGPGGPSGLGGPGGGGDGGPRNLGDIGAAIAAERRSQRLRELGNSPEEQVEHARQTPHGKMQMRTQNVEEPK